MQRAHSRRFRGAKAKISHTRVQKKQHISPARRPHTTRHRTLSISTTSTSNCSEFPYHDKNDVYGAKRTHFISDLENLPVGTPISLSGWVDRARDIGQVFFIVLRDNTGSIQATFEKHEAEAHSELFAELKQAKSTCNNGDVDIDTIGMNAYEAGLSLGNEYVVSIKGILQHRPGNVNKNMKLGDREVRIRSLRILNTSKPLPIQIHDEHDEMTNEDLRMKFRFLDLRRDYQRYLIKLRSQLTMAARQAMYMLGFNEIETPYLVKSTPEGAREFLVPSRSPGKFFALPQSPQQHKQLLMVSGFDKYFQIARCFRDESGRQDRQPGIHSDGLRNVIYNPYPCYEKR